MTHIAVARSPRGKGLSGRQARARKAALGRQDALDERKATQ